MATVVTPPVQALRTASHSPLALWHLLSLDAPSVAALWTIFLAHSFGVALTPGAPLALAIAVWLLYVGDRIRDAADCNALEERHRFHSKHRSALMSASVAAALPLCVLVERLPAALREGWLLLAIPLGCYVLFVHALRVRVPKEPLVAIFFAVATTMPVLISRRMPFHAFVPAALAFGAVCWLNGAAIARWEHTQKHSMDVVTGWLASHFPFALIAVLLAIACLLTKRAHDAGSGLAGVSIAAMLSVVLLLSLDRFRYHLQRTTLRALADAALLTPLIVWPLLAALKFA